MQELTFNQLQNYLMLKYKERGTSIGLFMKLVEEVGEVAEVLNQLEGRKANDGTASLEKELVDIIHYAVAIASINNINLSEVIVEKDKEAAIKYNYNPNLEMFLKRL